MTSLHYPVVFILSTFGFCKLFFITISTCSWLFQRSHNSYRSETENVMSALSERLYVHAYFLARQCNEKICCTCWSFSSFVCLLLAGLDGAPVLKRINAIEGKKALKLYPAPSRLSWAIEIFHWLSWSFFLQLKLMIFVFLRLFAILTMVFMADWWIMSP